MMNRFTIRNVVLGVFGWIMATNAIAMNFTLKEASTMNTFSAAAVQGAASGPISPLCRPVSQTNNSFGLLCLLCFVTDANNAVDQDTTTYSRIYVTAGLIAGRYQRLEFPGMLPAGTTVRIKIGVATGLLNVGVLSGTQVASYAGNTYNNDRTAATGGGLLSLTLLAGNQQGYISFTPTTPFDKIDIRLDGGLLGVTTELRVYHAYIDPTVPQITGGSNKIACDGDSVKFTIGNPVNNYKYFWYPADTSVTPLDSGTSYTTGVLNTSTSFYLDAIGPLGCALPGGRVRLNVNVRPIPVQPVITLSGDTICEGDSVLVTAAANAGVIYRLYDSLNGGTVVGKLPFTVKPVVTTTYYAEAKDSIGGCTPLSGRDSFTIVVNPRPVAPTMVMTTDDTLCQGDTAIIQASGSGAGVIYGVYDALSGGNQIGVAPLRVAPVSDSSFYVMAVSVAGCAQSTARATLNITSLLAPPASTAAVSQDSICVGDSVVITATGGGAGVTYEVYDAPQGGSLLGTAPLTVKPVISSSYYVFTRGTNLCPSITGDTVNVVVNQNPAVPSVSLSSDTICPGNTVIVDVLTPATGVLYEVYDAPAGGNLLGVAPYSTIPTAQTSFYVQATSPAGCGAATARVATTVSLYAAPVVPVVTVVGNTFCEGDSVVINATSATPNVTLNVYDSITGGTLLGQVPLTMVMTTTATFYVESVNANGCTPVAGRVSVNFIVNPAPASPLLTLSNDTICEGDSVLISASGSGAGISYEVYDAPVNGTLVGTAPLYVTPTASVTYAVIARSSAGCAPLSGAVQAQVTVNQTPVAPVLTSTVDTVCAGDSVTVNINAPQTGVTYMVYNSSVGGSPLVALPYTFAPVGNTTLYIEAVSAAGCGQASARTQYDAVVITPGTVMANNDATTTLVNTAVNVDVAANDAGANPSSIIITQNPANGTVVFAGNGIVTYTPANGFRGTDAFSYSICDVNCGKVCDSANVTIRVALKEPRFYNGVTPNNDGINEFFEVEGLEDLADNKVTIYNRWGSVIFEAAPYQNNWRGQCNTNCASNDIVNGTYYYLFEATDMDGKKLTYKGFIDVQK